MPLTGDAKRKYQREKMAERRAKTAKPTNESSEGADLGGEHYWGAVSLAPAGTRICTAFEFGPGNWIGGCGKIVPWEGKPLSTKPNGDVDLAIAIIESDSFKEILGKLPVTRDRR